MAKEIVGVRQPDGGQTGCWEVVMEVAFGIFVAGACAIGGRQLGVQFGRDSAGALLWLFGVEVAGLLGVLVLAWRGRVAYLIGYLMVIGVMGLLVTLCGVRVLR